MEDPIATGPQTLHTKAIADVLATLGRLPNDIEATPEPATPEAPPTWLREALLYVVRLPADQVGAMDRAAAEQVWTDYTTGQGQGPPCSSHDLMEPPWGSNPRPTRYENPFPC